MNIPSNIYINLNVYSTMSNELNENVLIWHIRNNIQNNEMKCLYCTSVCDERKILLVSFAYSHGKQNSFHSMCS